MIRILVLVTLVSAAGHCPTLKKSKDVFYKENKAILKKLVLLKQHAKAKCQPEIKKIRCMHLATIRRGNRDFPVYECRAKINWHPDYEGQLRTSGSPTSYGGQQCYLTFHYAEKGPKNIHILGRPLRNHCEKRKMHRTTTWGPWSKCLDFNCESEFSVRVRRRYCNVKNCNEQGFHKWITAGKPTSEMIQHKGCNSCPKVSDYPKTQKRDSPGNLTEIDIPHQLQTSTGSKKTSTITSPPLTKVPKISTTSGRPTSTSKTTTISTLASTSKVRNSKKNSTQAPVQSTARAYATAAATRSITTKMTSNTPADLSAKNATLGDTTISPPSPGHGTITRTPVTPTNSTKSDDNCNVKFKSEDYDYLAELWPSDMPDSQFDCDYYVFYEDDIELNYCQCLNLLKYTFKRTKRLYKKVQATIADLNYPYFPTDCSEFIFYDPFNTPLDAEECEEVRKRFESQFQYQIDQMEAAYWDRDAY